MSGYDIEAKHPPRYDIGLPRNGSYQKTWTLRDDDGNPIDLTGYTFAMAVKASAGAPGAAIANATIVPVGALTNGQISVTLLGSAFAAVPGPQDIVRLAYDFKATKASVPNIWVQGTIVLTPGVS